jgi:hypothetical protein
MATPEAKVKVFIDNFMKENFPMAFKYAPPGVGYFGKNGMPDRIWTIKAGDVFSIVIAIEAKADNGKPTDLQINTLKKLANQGAIAAIVVGKDINHLRRIRDEILRRLQLAPQES